MTSQKVVFKIRPSAWLTSDREWLKQRKKSWDYISKKLNHVHSIEIDRKQRTYLKNYYLKGIRPRYDLFLNATPIPLIFMLWFHPDQSEKCWQEIIDYIYQMPDIVVYEHYKLSFSIFMECSGNLNRFSPASGFSDGFMEGLEENMLPVLFGKTNERILSISKGWSLDRYSCTGGSHPASWFYSYSFLTSDINKVNRSLFTQYGFAIDLCFSQLNNKWIERFCGKNAPPVPGRKERERSRFYSYINYLASDKQPEGEFRKSYLEKLREKLNKGDIPPLLDELWQKAKKGELTVD
ncbi:hypothetical protein H0A36_06160 [Endozoicomonas sp. SM1973]|uniref:Uncharacterized protein n=1 Tax=Spartinivicinus marinus TaxID=2994442 RepID=A0A853HYZ2_9GAMM|nr:hypothetical protein [Spartinivicinus marinus]MCX4028254.1 hypothetical protein [Spartinivicinus marinus]NYZ65589.1 hypothetical protein [Spartinivicinus marinus]